MKHKIISIFLILLTSCIFYGCNKFNDNIIIEKDGVKNINYKKFGELLTVVELTEDNWKEHIFVIKYEEEIEEKDTFGDTISSTKKEHYVLDGNKEKYHYFEQAAIKLKNKKTGEESIYELSSGGAFLNEDLNLEDYELIKIKGYIYYVDLPEEAIQTPVPKWGYECGYILTDSNGSSEEPYRINKYTKSIYANGSSIWKERFIDKK